MADAANDSLGHHEITLYGNVFDLCFHKAHDSEGGVVSKINLTMSRSLEATSAVTVAFEHVVDVVISKIDTFLYSEIAIYNISIRGLECINYKIKDDHNGTISFYCSSYHFSDDISNDVIRELSIPSIYGIE